MITYFESNNYRCFKNINLENLSRINLIVGNNAAGKTALLENIRLALGGKPEILFNFNQFRQVPINLIQLTKESFEAIWRPYFFNFQNSNIISTVCRDSLEHEAKLKIYYDEKRAITPN